MQAKALGYLLRADECERRAAAARDPEIRRQYEDLARQWREMAAQVERQRGW
jgi:hypothetical protein